MVECMCSVHMPINCLGDEQSYTCNVYSVTH